MPSNPQKIARKAIFDFFMKYMTKRATYEKWVKI
jgi:hypothetical protein